uniref:Uncharacterized protein n=1 Tax=Schistocephalus solidus TaxID=70667 RepID=A0A0X3Q6A6_SCHSO
MDNKFTERLNCLMSTGTIYSRKILRKFYGTSSAYYTTFTCLTFSAHRVCDSRSCYQPSYRKWAPGKADILVVPHDLLSYLLFWHLFSSSCKFYLTVHFILLLILLLLPLPLVLLLNCLFDHQESCVVTFQLNSANIVVT